LGLSLAFTSQYNGIIAVNFRDSNLNALTAGSGNVFTYEIWPDRQFSVTSIYQHRQLNSTRPTEVEKCFHGGSNRAACVENVVDDHYRLAVDAFKDVRWHQGLP
jgi:hypothetical protein